jgi:hypothetical protein
MLGCDIQNQASTTATTSACPSTATTCSGAFVITLTNDPVDWPTAFPSDAALASSVYNYVQSLWSGQSSSFFCLLSRLICEL